MATGGYIPLQDVKDLNMCPIHLDIIELPKRLPCGHVICKSCLELKYKTDIQARRTSPDVVRCPMDQIDYKLSPNGIDGLPNDHRTQEINDVIHKNAKTVFCSLCQEVIQDGKINGYCFDCGYLMCHECVGKHNKSKQSNGHLTVAAANVSDLAEFQCPLHKGQYVKRYCLTCDKTVCQMCMFEIHEEHRFCEFKLTHYHTSQFDKINAYLAKALFEIDVNRKAIDQSQRNTESAISDYVTQIKSHVDIEHVRLLSESTQHHEQLLLQCIKAKLQIVEEQDKAKHLIDSVTMFKSFPGIIVDSISLKLDIKKSLELIRGNTKFPEISTKCVFIQSRVPDIGFLHLGPSNRNPVEEKILWEYAIGCDCFIEYSTKINTQIERAYMKKAPTVQWKNSSHAQYMIDFRTMKEHRLDKLTWDTVKVRRKSILEAK